MLLFTELALLTEFFLETSPLRRIIANRTLWIGLLCTICGISLAQTSVLTKNVTTAQAISLYGTPKHPHGGPVNGPYINKGAPKGGVITLPAFSSFNNLNPYLLKAISPYNTPGFGMWGIGELNEPLMVGTGNFLPNSDEPQTAYCLLCESLEYPDDYSWVRFKINPLAKFHNGEAITADDVVKSFELLNSDLAHPRFADRYRNVSGVEKESLLTVRFDFQPPYQKALLFRVGELPVMSHKFWEQHTFGKSGEIPQPLSGPYKIGRYGMGSFIEFERVPDHWGHNLPLYQGLFNFDKVRFEFFKDQTVAFEAFKAGRVDAYYDYIAKNWATAYDFPALHKGVVTKAQINHDIPSGAQGFFINTRRARFANREVRKALSLLFDFEWTNKNIFASAYQRSQSLFPNSSLGATGTPPSAAEKALLKPFVKQLPEGLLTQPFELSKTQGNGNIRPQLREALSLLKKAGWDLHSGRLINRTTLKAFTLEILIDQPSLARMLTPYVKNLKQAGIKADIRLIDRSHYKRRLDDLDFDMVSFVLPQSLSPSHEQRLYFHSNTAATPGTRNYAGIKHPAVDAMIEKIIHAKSREELQAATRAMDRVLLWEHYTIPHWFINYHRIAYWNRLARPQQTPKLNLGFPSWWLQNPNSATLKDVVTP